MNRDRRWTHGEHRRRRPVDEHQLYGALLMGVVLGATAMFLLVLIMEARG